MQNLGLIALTMGTLAIGAQKETMRVSVSKNLLQTGLQSTINEKRDVTGKMMDSTVTGTAATTGSLKVDLVPNPEAAALSIQVETATESHTVGVNHPKSGLTVNVHSTAYTPAKTSQVFLFNAGGITAQAPTVVPGKSTIYYEGIDVQSSTGPLSNIARMSAEQEAWQQAQRLKAHNEDLTSQRVADEMRSYFSDSLKKSIDSFNHIYQVIFFQPVFGGDTGRTRAMHLSTTADALSASITSEAPDTLTPAPEFDGGNALALRIHESLASRYFGEAVEAKVYDEEDLEEFFIMHGIASGLGNYRDGDAEARVKFCAQDPITVSFQTLQIAFSLCAQELTFKNEKASGVKIGMTYTSRLNPDGSVDLVRLEDPSFDNAPGLSPATVAELQKRFARIFPEQMTIPKIHLAGQFGSQGDLVTHRADLGDGWLVSELWFDPASHKPTQGGKKK